MNDVQRSFVTAGIVCGASVCLIAGIHARQRIESGVTGIPVANALDPGLVASNTKEVKIPDERYYFELTALLKREFVDPIEDEAKLASGSVKGMISSLNDERSLFMSEPLFHAFTQTLVGNYEGIGVQLTLLRPPQEKDKPIQTSMDLLQRVPRVVVTAVAPGGPADRAGLKPGDEVERIDGRWVVNPDVADRYRAVERQIKAKTLPPTALSELENEMRAKFKDSMMPMRALERLSVGESGPVKLQYRRDGKIVEVELIRAKHSVPFNTFDKDGNFRLSFVSKAADALKSALQSKPGLTIDLQGVRHGDLDAMAECLAAIAPAGTYGKIVSEKGDVQTVKSATGNDRSGPPVRILVDRYTAGIAEAFVLALQPTKRIVVEGGKMAGDPSIIERTELPDGAGFTLRIGTFKAGGAQ